MNKKIGFDDDLLALEYQLSQVLQPVTPRPEFVRELHQRLVNRSLFFQFLPQKIEAVVLILGGLIGSIAIILMSFRAILSFVSVIGVLTQHYRRQLKKQRGISTPRSAA
jgi:hypothetical protein